MPYRNSSWSSWGLFWAGLLFAATPALAQNSKPANDLPQQAQAILKAHCYRCHGQDGAVEGGLNYAADLAKLVTRRKVIPHKPAESPLWKRIDSGSMPPPEVTQRLSNAEKATLKSWIEAGAPVPSAPVRPQVTLAVVHRVILEDLDQINLRARRFQRYFTLHHLWNAGLSEEELATYRNALSKLINSLSWHPKIRIPEAIDPHKTVFRIDLRWYMWDATLWNRLLNDYPYGVIEDGVGARALAVHTASRVPLIRGDWFIATASRPPLYQDLLQLPTNLAELERQLRVDPAFNILQERVYRAGFNGSGVSRNNRILERHDSVHGAYWRTYDFEEVPQNLTERGQLLPDRRNIFAYPLGPGNADNQFQHVGGEVIFSLPNGLHGYMLVNTANIRIDKGPVNIVSDPRRPDRAVETGVSCMACHITGILPKADQVHEYVLKNPKAFSRADAEVIRALYPPKERTLAVMEEDARRYQAALEQAGAKVIKTEAVSTMTIRYEADLDLNLAAAEVGLKPNELRAAIEASPILSKNLGALLVPGGVVARQLWVQAFGDLVKELRLGVLLQATQSSGNLPDNTGEVDPLEGSSNQLNAAAISADGRRVLLASADRSVRLWDVEANRDIRRLIGHSASVWCVAFSADEQRAISGGMDKTVRVWDVNTGRQLLLLEGHDSLVACVALSADARFAASGGVDRTLILWDLAQGKEAKRLENVGRFVTALHFLPGAARVLVAVDEKLHVWDLEANRLNPAWEGGHTAPITALALSSDAKQLLTASDDGTVKLWDMATRKPIRTLTGHRGYVKSVAFHREGHWVLTGGSDTTVRLWETATGKELGVFRKHNDPLIGVGFTPSGRQTVSVSRDSAVQIWGLAKFIAAVAPTPPPMAQTPDSPKPENPVAPAPPKPRTLKVQPTTTIPIGSTIGPMLLSPNHRWLYCLNLTDHKLIRVDAADLKSIRELRLAEGTEAIALTPNGKTLAAITASGLVQLIDPLKFVTKKLLPLDEPIFDIALTNEVAYLSSAKTPGTGEVLVLDLKTDAVVARWPLGSPRSFLKLSADGKRLFLSTQGVSPAWLEYVELTKVKDNQPVVLKVSAKPNQSLGGDFEVSPDGTRLVFANGWILPESGEGTKIDPWISATFDGSSGSLFTLTPTNWLRQYAVAEGKQLATEKLPITAYRLAFDPSRNRLWVAVIDPKTIGERGRAKAHSDIWVIDLAAK